MRSKLLPAEAVRKKSLECAVNITKKKKQRELDAIIKWIEEASEEGYTETILDNDALQYEENIKELEDAGYIVEKVRDYGKKIRW